MGKLPKPSLFVLSLVGALAVGPGPWAEETWGRALAGGGEFASLVAQAPASTPVAAPQPTSAAAEQPTSLPVVTLSPDGQYMVRGTAAGNLEWLDDQGQATSVTVSQAHQGPVRAVVITHDGQTVISAGADGALRRWDRQGNTLGETMLSQGSALVVLALSPDGQTLLGGRADGLVEQWSVANGTPLGDPIAAHAAAIQTLNYMAGGQIWLTGSQDGSLALWNADGSPMGRLESVHGGGITQVASSPDGQVIVTTGGDGTLRFWDRVTLQPRGDTLLAHEAPIRAVAYSPDGLTVATAAADGTLRLWNADGTSLWGGPARLTSDPRFLGFTPAGDLVIGTSDGRIERRGPDGNVVAVTRSQPAPGDATSSPETWPDKLQRLPKNTWWILAAVPALLILIGSLGAMVGGKRSPDDTEDENDAVAAPDLTTEERLSPPVYSAPAPPEDTAPESILPESTTWPEASSPSALAEELPPEAALTWDAPPEGPAADFAAETEPASGLTSGTRRPTPPLPPEADLVPAAAAPQPLTNKLEQARADLAEGRKHLREGLYEAGLLCFNSAIEATEVERLKAETQGALLGGINALATQSQTQRGHALALLEQPGDAMESYNTALALDSTAVEAWIGKGRLLIAMGRYEEALFCFDSALEIDSSLGPAWAGKAQALLRLGRLAEGQTCHHRATALGLESLGPLPPYPTLDPATLGPSASTAPPLWPGGDVTAASAPVDQPDLADDPDIPQELQQVVMGLPSADTDLAYAFPSDYGVPPELAEDVAQLPSEAESSSPETAWIPSPIEPASPLPSDLGTAPWIRPVPSDTAPDSNTPENAQSLPSTEPAQPAAPSVTENWNPDQGWPTPKANAIDPSAHSAPEPSPTVSIEPGDFVPPAEFDDNWPQDLPPELLAAMASIPAGSPDAFGPLPLVDNPDAAQAQSATPPQSWVKLSLDRTQGPRFYALWHLDDEDRRQAKQAGGDVLAIRLYDVTGHPTQTPLPPPVEEQRCHDDFAQDWYLAIPQWDRIYLAEVGYLSASGQWQVMARSSEVPAIAAR